MADEYESTNEITTESTHEGTSEGSGVYYSPFWPMTIVLAGFILWLGYQLFTLNQQRSNMSSQLDQMGPALQQANAAQNRLVTLLKDLGNTSATDPYAKQIIKEAIDAGLLRVNPNAGTNGAPAVAPAAAAAAPASSN